MHYNCAHHSPALQLTPSHPLNTPSLPPPPLPPSPSHSTPFTIRTGSGHGFSHAICFPIGENPFPVVAGVRTRHHTSIPITTRSPVGFVESRYHTNHTRPSQSAFAPCIPHPRSAELQELSPYLFTPIDLEYRTKGGEDRTEFQLKKPSENRNQHDG